MSKEQQSPMPAAPAAPQVAPEVKTWIAQNPWFNANAEATAVAIAIHGVVTAQFPTIPLADLLAETTRRMHQRYPELFQGLAAPRDPLGAAALMAAADQEEVARIRATFETSVEGVDRATALSAFACIQATVLASAEPGLQMWLAMQLHHLCQQALPAALQRASALRKSPAPPPPRTLH